MVERLLWLEEVCIRVCKHRDTDLAGFGLHWQCEPELASTVVRLLQLDLQETPDYAQLQLSVTHVGGRS